MRKPANERAEDLVDELPPLDNGEDDERSDLEGADEIDPGLDRVEHDTEPDDSPAIDVPPDQLLDLFPDISACAEDDSVLDTGEPDFMPIAETENADDDMPGLEGEDTSVGIDAIPEHASTEKSEDEGTESTGDEVDEDALPEIDSDEEADLPGGLKLDVGLTFDEEVALPGWAAARWERVPTPLVAVPMTCVSVAGDQVLAAGDGLVVVHCQDASNLHASWPSLRGLPATELLSVCAYPMTPSRLLLAAHHLLLLSEDGGETVHEVALPQGLARCDIRTCHSFAHGRAVGLVTTSGELFTRRNGEGWKPFEPASNVLASTVDSMGTLWVLSHRADRYLMIRSIDAADWTEQPVTCAAARASVTVSLGVRGQSVAVASARGPVSVSGDRGTTWFELAVPPQATSVAVSTHSGRNEVVGTLFIESQDKSYVFAVGPDGAARLAADLSPDVAVGSANVDESEGLGRACAVAWDECRGWLWIAGAFGLVAWRPVIPT